MGKGTTSHTVVDVENDGDSSLKQYVCHPRTMPSQSSPMVSAAQRQLPRKLALHRTIETDDILDFLATCHPRARMDTDGHANPQEIMSYY